MGLEAVVNWLVREGFPDEGALEGRSEEPEGVRRGLGGKSLTVRGPRGWGSVTGMGQVSGHGAPVVGDWGAGRVS